MQRKGAVFWRKEASASGQCVCVLHVSSVSANPWELTRPGDVFKRQWEAL